jgi:hypothetical protein
MKLKHFVAGIAILMIFLIVSMPICFATELSLSYDSNGNLVTGDGKYRTYNSLNQLYRVYNGSNTSGTLLYEFKYHPIEERVLVKKSYNSSGSVVETVYYWSQNFITVVNASGSYNFTYVYHNGDLVAQQNPDGTKLFVLGDNKGSTSVITNSSGAVLERTSYSPTGEVLSGGRLNRYGYEAKEQELGFGKVPTNGLVSYYALEGGAFDDGVGNQGAITNATLTTGKVRDAYSFSGGSYVKVNDSNSLDMTGNITISAWINPRSSTQGYIVAKYGAYMIQFMTTNTTQGGIWSGGAWKQFVGGNTPQNTWTHVVFTYDRVTARMYINGVSVQNFTNTSAIDATATDLYIGAKNSTDRTRDFNGSIDEVGVWNRALTQDEITQLYNYGSQFESGFRSTDFNSRKLSTTLGPIFEQPDTLISNVYEPQNLNRYMFEGGNPYKNRDVSGHFWFDWVDRVSAAIKYNSDQIGASIHNSLQSINNVWVSSGASSVYNRLPFIKDSVDVMFGLEALNNGAKGLSSSRGEANQRIENGVFGLISLGATSLGASGSNLIKNSFVNNILELADVYSYVTGRNAYQDSYSLINSAVDYMSSVGSSSLIFGKEGVSAYSGLLRGFLTSSGSFYPTIVSGWVPQGQKSTQSSSGGGGSQSSGSSGGSGSSGWTYYPSGCRSFGTAQCRG